MTLDEPVFEAEKADLEEVGVGTKEKPTRRLSDVRCRALGRRLAHEFREAPRLIRENWWPLLHCILRGEGVIALPTSSTSTDECDKEFFASYCFGPERRFRRPVARFALRKFLSVLPEDQREIMMYALHAIPHPAAWYSFAWFNICYPEHRWAKLRPLWDINTSWNDVPTDNNERTLHWACHYGSEDSVAFLIAAGADVEAIDANGRTPLHFTARRASFTPCGEITSFAIVDLLLERGADIDALDMHGESPLFYASDMQMARFLIGRGANTDLRTKVGNLFTEEYDYKTSKIVENGLRFLVEEDVLHKALRKVECVSRSRI